jgi:uncharacterized glyoxalase superfamily protein PhnB
MPADFSRPGSTILSTLRYRDVAAAIEWLCNAFGFAKHLVVSGDNGAVRYAELTFGSGMIMLGPVEDSGVDKFMTQPAHTGGAETQICYLFVADATAHCAKAKAAGSEIVLDLEDADGRGYSCRDLEGHVWNFGTYDPWKRRTASAGALKRHSAGLHGGLQRLADVTGFITTTIVSAAVVGWALSVADVTNVKIESAASARVAEATVNAQQDELARAHQAREAAEREAKDVMEQLARERGAREATERVIRAAASRPDRAATERALLDARQQLANERSALEIATRIEQDAHERLVLVERSTQAGQDQLAAERSAREGAERGDSASSPGA